MDALAAEGVRFENAYCTIPLTGPSHVSLFSSRYPQEHGVRINGVPIPKDSKWMYLPQILLRFGYFNAAFVSAWPLVSHLTGFSHWFQVYDEEMKRRYQFLSSSRFAGDVTPRAIAWLADQRVEPFFSLGALLRSPRPLPPEKGLRRPGNQRTRSYTAPRGQRPA